MHSRERIYRFLWNIRDQRDCVALSQGEVADRLGISYQAMSEIFSEFKDMGMLEKHKHDFLVVYDPDKIPWGPKFTTLRKKYLKQKSSSEDK